MTGYMRRWDCDRCGVSQESMDWPKVAVCDTCERKEQRAHEARAVAYAGAFLAAHDQNEAGTAAHCRRVADRLEREAK
jgi:hypothetical protein